MLASANKPYIQANYSTNILPALAKLIASDKKNLRVRTESFLSLTSFLKGLVNEGDSGEVNDYSDLLKPYSNELLSLLAQTFSLSLKIDNYTLQKATLSCISLIATILGQEYYAIFKRISCKFSILTGTKERFNSRMYQYYSIYIIFSE